MGIRTGRLVLLAVLILGLTPRGAGAVVGGHRADQGEYPFVAAVYRTDPRGGLLLGGQFCGGSLIAPSVVLTGKHCVQTLMAVDNALGLIPLSSAPVVLAVMLGEVRLDRQGERIRVRSVSVHPQRNSDLALLELMSPSVQAPAAWARAEDLAAYPPGAMATIAGWGATREGGSGSVALLEAEVPIVSDVRCGDAYPNEIVAASMVCAGFEEGGVDTCQGDSGGPLMVPRPGGAGWLGVGTTWFGDGCARPGKFGVYSEVAFGEAFIDPVASGTAASAPPSVPSVPGPKPARPGLRLTAFSDF